jgi:hypothetical protein
MAARTLPVWRRRYAGQIGYPGGLSGCHPPKRRRSATRAVDPGVAAIEELVWEATTVSISHRE